MWAGELVAARWRLWVEMVPWWQCDAYPHKVFSRVVILTVFFNGFTMVLRCFVVFGYFCKAFISFVARRRSFGPWKSVAPCLGWVDVTLPKFAKKSTRNTVRTAYDQNILRILLQHERWKRKMKRFLSEVIQKARSSKAQNSGQSMFQTLRRSCLVLDSGSLCLEG